MPPPTRPAPPPAITPRLAAPRRHDIDALRAIAFLLVIVYHVGMYYVADWHWHIKSPHAATWLAWPMRALNLWRMDLVFLISGVSLAFLLRDGVRGAPVLRSRALRLLLPLAFGMVVIVPYQVYAQGEANGLIAPGFGAFIVRYLTMAGPWPHGAFDGSDVGITWNHLWYLPYLFVYTALVIMARPLGRTRPGMWLRRRFAGLRGAGLLLWPALPLLLFAWLLQRRFPATHDFIGDGYLHCRYFTVFVYGCWIGQDAGFWQEALRLRHRALVWALCAFGGHVVVRTVGDLPLLDAVLRTLYLWTAVVAILGFAHRHLDRPWPWLARANASVYPWYMLHQTLIILLAVALAPLALGPVWEPALLLAGTLVACWLLTDGLIRRVDGLRLLFGLPPGARH